MSYNYQEEGDEPQGILCDSIFTSDPKLSSLLILEKQRQINGLQMIASENVTSEAVLQVLGSSTTNKYSEGLPGKRYYAGNLFIDLIEKLAKERALEAFDLNPDEWGVNVQPYSGSVANMAVYTALLKPHDRLMGLDLPDGGHLSHGYHTPRKNVSATSLFFESLPYKINPVTKLIDYEQLEDLASRYRPKIIVAGTSSYSRCLDYKRFRIIAEQNNSFLMVDMAHIAGLVAAKIIPSPFDEADIVTTTTHKTLRGPRGAMIFYRKGQQERNGMTYVYDLEDRINSAIFPGIQGGPHNNVIAAIATAMHQVKSTEFVFYMKQTVDNAWTLAKILMDKGYWIVTGGTDNHMIILDLYNVGMNGAEAEHILNKVNITCNRNTLPGDDSPLCPSAIRLGTAAITSRGINDMVKVGDFIHQALQIGKEVISMEDNDDTFYETLNTQYFSEKIDHLAREVGNFSKHYVFPNKLVI